MNVNDSEHRIINATLITAGGGVEQWLMNIDSAVWRLKWCPKTLNHGRKPWFWAEIHEQCFVARNNGSCWGGICMNHDSFMIHDVNPGWPRWINAESTGRPKTSHQLIGRVLYVGCKQRYTCNLYLEKYLFKNILRFLCTGFDRLGGMFLARLKGGFFLRSCKSEE